MGNVAQWWRGIALLAVAAMVLAACGPGTTDVGEEPTPPADGDPTPADADEPVGDPEETFTIRLPHTDKAGGNPDQCTQAFADEAEERSNGRLTFEITPGGALGGEIDVQENVFNNVFQMTLMSNVIMGVWVPEANVTNLPFVFDDHDQARTILHGDELQTVYDQLLEQHGARVLPGWCLMQFRSIAATRPLRTPEDFANLKVRIPELDLFVDTFNALGANPTPVPFPEVYNAIRTGVVDAADSPFQQLRDNNIHEVASFFSATRHAMTALVLVINEEFFQSLPDDLQQILVEAAANAEEAHFPAEQSADEDVADELEAAGITVVTDVDYDALRAAVADTADQLAEQYGVTELRDRIFGGR